MVTISRSFESHVEYVCMIYCRCNTYVRAYLVRVRMYKVLLCLVYCTACLTVKNVPGMILRGDLLLILI